MNSLTGTEQRFVLAEIIKASSVDIKALANFVKLNSIMPDWYNMQLPNGRNMNQCIRFAQSLSIPIPTTQQPPTLHNDHVEQSPSDYPRHGVAMTSPESRHPGLPPIAPGAPYNLLPRPLSNGTEEGSIILSPVLKSPARKRGRPSRSDTSRRELTPRHAPIAPKPAQLPPGPNAPTPRTILPAINRGLEPPASTSLATSPPSLSNGSRGKKKRRLTSPPPTPVVNKSPPQPPRRPPSPSAVAMTVEKESGGREADPARNTKTPPREICS